MFDLAIDSKLRGCDVVAIKVEDIAASGYPYVFMRKTITVLLGLLCIDVQHIKRIGEFVRHLHAPFQSRLELAV
jgi:hypothetical protein